MAQCRERGIYRFATPPPPLGVLTAKYRLLRERGDWESFQRTVMPIPTLAYEPHIPCLDTDLSPEAMFTCSLAMEPLPANTEQWMMQESMGFTNRTMRQAERVYDSLGEDYVVTHFCPVAWATTSNPSEKELKEKAASIIASSGHVSTPLYNIAVSDESLRQYGVSMPVIWMRRSFLRTFKSGNDLLNIYRMMGKRITEKYDIPAFREEEGTITF